MEVCSLRFLFAVLSVTILLCIQCHIYQEWKHDCGSHASQKYVASAAGINELDAVSFKKGRSLQSVFDGVETFVMFIGYARTGHSLVGSLLDAHPEIIISHEYTLVEEWRKTLKHFSGKAKKYHLFYEIYSMSERQALFGVRSPSFLFQGYSYHVPGTWQGTYNRRIQVIGDKRGDITSNLSPSKFVSFSEELGKVTELPLKLIHVVRNPFDIISTNVLRKAKERDSVRNSSVKVNNSELLDSNIQSFFRQALTNNETLKRYGKTTLTLKSHELIERPQETLQRLCNHLMVTCYQEYMDACAKAIYTSVPVTRNSVVWTDKQKERVLREMEKYSFLKGYNFEDIS